MWCANCVSMCDVYMAVFVVFVVVLVVFMDFV